MHLIHQFYSVRLSALPCNYDVTVNIITSTGNRIDLGLFCHLNGPRTNRDNDRWVNVNTQCCVVCAMWHAHNQAARRKWRRKEKPATESKQTFSGTMLHNPDVLPNMNTSVQIELQWIRPNRITICKYAANATIFHWFYVILSDEDQRCLHWYVICKRIEKLMLTFSLRKTESRTWTEIDNIQ